MGYIRGPFEVHLRYIWDHLGAEMAHFFWYDLALESKARFFASISSKHPFTRGFLIYTAKQWNDGSTMHFLVLQGLKLTVKQDYSPTYIFPFPKSSSIPIRYFHLFLHLSATYPQDLFKDPEILCFPSFLTSFGFLTSYVMLLYCLPVSFILSSFWRGLLWTCFCK